MPSATRERLAQPERQDDESVAPTLWRHAPTVAWVAYIVLYGPLRSLLGTHTGVLAFIPVLITAHSLGAWYGVAAGVASVPATIVAGLLVGTVPAPATWLQTPALAGAAAMMLVGYAVGRIEELRASAMREVSRRRLAEVSLRERDRHLGIASDLWTKLRRCKVAEDVPAASVETLHHHFPEFRVGYTVFDETGQATRVCWWKPGGPLRTEPLPSSLVLSDDQIERLRLAELYAIDDVNDTVNPRGLSTHLMERGTRAFLTGVTQHPGVKLALLTLSSSRPHVWTKDERQGLGDAIGFISQTLSDIEGRRHQKESEARFRALSEHSGAGIFLIANKQVIYVNHALQSITGYSESELRDQQVWRLLHPSHRALAEKSYPDRLDAPVAGVPFETQLVTKVGRTRWIESRATVIELSGEPTMLGTVLDVTDRKRTEERVRADEKRFRAMLEDTLDGVGVLVNGRIAYANTTLGAHRSASMRARSSGGPRPRS